ncbi:hypothetical protein EZV62_004599 [Acer yangbiense]|uniref:Uncharacterized protein n=1 Tax=Acer yangbiense TaxID=1000413 RepID=A0A5C7ILC8_9ROSI|nr:hypothetical protein EZV62_004599 [Acer yangbiense]
MIKSRGPIPATVKSLLLQLGHHHRHKQQRNVHSQKVEKLARFRPISELELPPIFTKPAKFRKSSEQVSVKIFKEESVRTQKQHRTRSCNTKIIFESTGIKLRPNSPRIASKKIQAYSRKSIHPTSTRIRRKEASRRAL